MSQALRGPEQWRPSSTYKQKHIRRSANSCIRYDIIDSSEVEASGIFSSPLLLLLLLFPQNNQRRGYPVSLAFLSARPPSARTKRSRPRVGAAAGMASRRRGRGGGRGRRLHGRIIIDREEG